MPDEPTKALTKAPIRDLAVSYPAQPGTIVHIQRDDPYSGAAERPCSKEQASALCGPVERDQVRILPDTGSLYLAWEWYAHRLTAAFGPMGWSLLPVLDAQGQPIPPKVEDNVIYREYILRVDKRFVASAFGECAYRASNKHMTWGDAAEGARSNSLSRCCKSLGMAHEIYSETWREAWKKEFALCVNALSWGGKIEAMWRKRSMPPLKGEQNHANPPCPCELCEKGVKTMAADDKPMPEQPKEAVVDGTNPRVGDNAGMVRKIHAVAKGNGWSEDQFRAKLEEKYKTRHVHELTLDGYNDALDFFRRTKP